MQAGTPAQQATGSKTIADLSRTAAQQAADHVAIRHKRDGAWHDVTFAEVHRIVSEIGRGLIDLGVAPGERVCILSNTRPEWTYADFAISAAGAVVVPIYPTNSAEECEWVIGNSEAVAVIVEDAEQMAKGAPARERLPKLRHVVVIDPAGDTADAMALDDLRERGRRHDAAELDARTDAVVPDDPYTFIYTSGTTGPPKGCVLSHRNYRSVLDMCLERGFLQGDDQLVYLYLPLAHAFALRIQLGAVDTGTAIAYWGGDTKQIIPEVMEVKPTYLPSVPRIFEKLYTLAQGQLAAEDLAAIRDVGGRVRDLEVAGEELPADLREQWAPLQPKADFVKSLFGG